MNQREAKQEACRRAASCLNTAMSSGWPVWNDDSGEPNYDTDQDGQRVADALNQIIEELERRGGLAPRTYESTTAHQET